MTPGSISEQLPVSHMTTEVDNHFSTVLLSYDNSLDILNTSLTWDIFNLQWGYMVINPCKSNKSIVYIAFFFFSSVWDQIQGLYIPR
jgi:hypothetical protein